MEIEVFVIMMQKFSVPIVVIFVLLLSNASHFGAGFKVPASSVAHRRSAFLVPQKASWRPKSVMFGRPSRLTLKAADPLCMQQQAPPKPHTQTSMSLWNVPNILTMFRLLAVPFFVYTSFQNMRAASFFIFVAASVTDYFDGFLARKLNQQSEFGAFLDPVADKLMVSAALIFILSTIPAELVALPVSIIICREIAVSALREWMAQRNIHHAVKVGNLGKIKTTLQMLAATTLLLVYKSIDTTDMSIASTMGFSLVKLVLIGILLLYSAAIASLVSGIQYFIAASKVIAYENTTCQTKYSITTTHQEVNQAKCQN